jgi:4,5-dihydroxyphthalate decarboxylase
MELELSAAFMENVRTRPIVTGEVAPKGIRLHASELYPTEIFWRQLHHGEFDVSEMSVSSLMIAISKGIDDWVGIPVFTMRRFFHTGVMIRTDRGIAKPEDLAGKKVGVPEFQQTSALWTRGVLRDEFGLQPASMEWFMERNPEQSHGGATGFRPPQGVRLSYVPREKSLGRMLVDGELDALMHFSPGRNIIDRTTVDPLTSPMVRRLFDPPATEAGRYYAKTGIYPINHCIVVRRTIAERHPWVAASIFDAFVGAKALVARRTASLLEPFAATGVVRAAAIEATRADVLPYGIDGARSALEAISRFLAEDGLTGRPVTLGEVFEPHALEV